MDPPNVDVDVQVLVLFLGVEHTVVSYYVTESETWGELLERELNEAAAE